MLTLVLGVQSLVLPHLPARGDHALRSTHAVSGSSHWVVPGLLLQGDGSPQAQGEVFEVGCLKDIHSLGTAVADIEKRDARDRDRKDAPMRAADDAYLLDTSNLSIEEAFNAAVAIVEKVAAAKA